MGKYIERKLEDPKEVLGHPKRHFSLPFLPAKIIHAKMTFVKIIEMN